MTALRVDKGRKMSITSLKCGIVVDNFCVLPSSRAACFAPPRSFVEKVGRFRFVGRFYDFPCGSPHFDAGGEAGSDKSRQIVRERTHFFALSAAILYLTKRGSAEGCGKARRSAAKFCCKGEP